jgi:hypothetical protein
MCGGALSVACADCADAVEPTVRTRAAANAASFAFDILSPSSLEDLFTGGRNRAPLQERRVIPADVNRDVVLLGLRLPFG